MFPLWYVDYLGKSIPTILNQIVSLLYTRLSMGMHLVGPLFYMIISTHVLILDKTTPPFYMFAYIMDDIFLYTPFPQMGWDWTHSTPQPIHIYHSKLWEV